MWTKTHLILTLADTSNPHSVSGMCKSFRVIREDGHDLYWNVRMRDILLEARVCRRDDEGRWWSWRKVGNKSD